MKIVIRSEDSKKLVLRFPLVFIKSRLFLKIISLSEEHIVVSDIIKKAYKELKKFIRENGHFVLINVISSDGTKVKVVV